MKTMINALLKVAAEQVLDSRPALEQPITHLKYGLLGGLAAGMVVSIGVTTLSAALFFWLTSNGLEVASSLLVTGLFLLMQSALIWITSNYLGQKQASPDRDLSPEIAEHASGPKDPLDELKALGIMIAREAAEGFVQGLKTEPVSKHNLSACIDEESASDCSQANEHESEMETNISGLKNTSIDRSQLN